MNYNNNPAGLTVLFATIMIVLAVLARAVYRRRRADFELQKARNVATAVAVIGLIAQILIYVG